MSSPLRSAITDSIARLANPFGSIADPTPWYRGFVRDRDSLRGDFWNAIVSYTLSDESADQVPGQGRLFDPERVGA
jgi:hypothetical protein